QVRPVRCWMHARTLARRGIPAQLSWRSPRRCRRRSCIDRGARRRDERRLVTEPCDVAIVGYGPVGQTLAILLGQQGRRVVVLEKQPAAYPLPRAVHFDHEVGRILQAAGVADRLAGVTEVADVYEWRNAAGATLLRFESRAAGISGWPEANMFPQPDLERLLGLRARSLPTVEVRRGREIVG